jgi:alkyl hydroperoxide reductase subunit AhpC
MILLDFTPVATTELVVLTQLQSEFARRGVKLFALSTQNTRREGEYVSHDIWVKDVNELSGSSLLFPIIRDDDGTVSRLFNV